MILAIEERSGREPPAADIGGALRATLAFNQADDDVRARWGHVAEAVRSSYAAVDPERRRRWARVGTSIASAREVDAIADDVVVAALAAEERSSAEAALDVLERAHAIERLLEPLEAPPLAVPVGGRGRDASH